MIFGLIQAKREVYLNCHVVSVVWGKYLGIARVTRQYKLCNIKANYNVFKHNYGMCSIRHDPQCRDHAGLSFSFQ